ncbi:hemerythrin domain-containing protein [Novipirellula sp. SH528]|uniref:hemerythrin domain-containing protein n=1 Tax=Novipirellula sp. SH528 TaxID=3454466 RepID=UPI003FA081F3
MTQNATSTRRLAVNAAFLKDIKDDNHHLKILVDKIGPMVSHPKIATNHWLEIIDLFSEFRDQLALHFSLEEAFGYFDEAIDTSPELSTQAETLRSQHTTLFESIRHLTESASEVTADQEEKIARLLVRYDTFLRSFAQHEEAELKLILEAFDDDIGVGD